MLYYYSSSLNSVSGNDGFREIWERWQSATSIKHSRTL